MSTISKLTPTIKNAKGRRREALAFFQARAKSPGAVGVVAGVMYSTLLAIHRAPDLNGMEKEVEFKRIIRRARGIPGGLDGVDATASTADRLPEQPEHDLVGDVPAGDSLPAE